MKRPVLHLVPYSAGVGDVILHTPCIRAWKKANPAGKLIVTCQLPYQREVLRGNPYIDSLRLLSWVQRFLGTFALVQRWSKRRYQFSNYGRYVPGFLGKPAGQVIGEALGIDVVDVTPEIYLQPQELERARRWIASFTAPVALHVVGRCSGNKLWAVENWTTLVRECPDLQFIQLGLDDEPLIPGAVDMRALPLRQSFAITALCRAFVGVDSGPAHAAGALKVPAVVLFGPTPPKVWGHPTAVNLYVPQRCAPCIDTLYSGTCPYDSACMNAISVEAVKEALRRILSRGDRR
jgi:ADP-heptose:LPS heptosyltransferase